MYSLFKKRISYNLFVWNGEYLWKYDLNDLIYLKKKIDVK